MFGLEKLRKEQQCHSLFELFKDMVKESGGSLDKVDMDFLREFFKRAGVEDYNTMAEHLFRVMDYNHNGKLEVFEVSAIMTLLQSGKKLDRFRFLFRVLDFDES